MIPILQPFYYGGSKRSKLPTLLPLILDLLHDPAITEYREPFLGSGVVGLSLLGRAPRRLTYWLNDRDPACAAFWLAVREFPDRLIDLVERFDCDPTQFDLYRQRLSITYRVPDDDDGLVELAFAKLVVQQCSHMGYGGGRRGGDQSRPERNRFAGRWYPEKIVRTIRNISGHFALQEVRVSGYDFSRLIEEPSQTGAVLVYLDPPYLGYHGLYPRPFSLADHERLAALLRQSRHAFALSHRHHDTIRELYSWAKISQVDASDMLITRSG
jgi:site-specific DNA-adenine methylase